MNKDASTLLQQQSDLQRDARKVINDLSFEKILSEYGDVVYVGSYALGLMVWEDVDVNLFFSNVKEMQEAYWKIAKKFSNKQHVQLLILANNLDAITEKDRPKSLYMGLKYDFHGTMWKFDVRFMERKDDMSLEYLNSTKTYLNARNISTILELKHHFMHSPTYGKEFGGFHIYEAVLKGKVKNVKEFNSYLQKKGFD